MDARRWPARGPWRFVGLAGILLLVGLVLWLGSRVVQPPPTVDWGPLAVVKTQEQPAARGPGTLRITETCVALIRPDGRGALLVWPADRVAWVAAEDAVRFRNLDGTVHVLRGWRRRRLARRRRLGRAGRPRAALRLGRFARSCLLVSRVLPGRQRHPRVTIEPGARPLPPRVRFR
jgi:hypothetical protein